MRPMFMMLFLALVLTACSGTSPTSTTAAAGSYDSDLVACSDGAHSAVNKQNAKTGHAWLLSPITRWPQIDDARDACMAGKGWGRTRACTAEELRAGNRTPSLVVSASGVRCSDPGRPR